MYEYILYIYVTNTTGKDKAITDHTRTIEPAKGSLVFISSDKRKNERSSGMDEKNVRAKCTRAKRHG